MTVLGVDLPADLTKLNSSWPLDVSTRGVDLPADLPKLNSSWPLDVFSTPENLLGGISGALGMNVSHFLSRHVFWENAVEYLRNGECYSFQTFAIVFSTPKNVLVEISGALGTQESHFVSKNVFWENAGDFWNSRNDRKPLCQQKCVLRKCWVSQKWWVLELSNLCHCVQHPWKCTGKDFWSSRNDRKPLCQQKCVLRKCCWVSQKWWVLELSNLCHCVQHP